MGVIKRMCAGTHSCNNAPVWTGCSHRIIHCLHDWLIHVLLSCAALLQEMEKDWRSALGSTMIPAHWGQGIQTLHKCEDDSQSAQVHKICAMPLHLPN